MLKILTFRCSRSSTYSKIRFYCTSKPTETIVTEVVKNTTKTSFLQKWTTYWKNLLDDYKTAMIEGAKHAKEHPVKSTIWLTIVTGVYTCSVLNPDENNFRENIIRRSHELIFIGKSIRNPATIDHLQTIESYYNSDQIKRISFGVFSIILRDFKTKNSGVYRDNCSYTQPTYWEIIRENIVDVGFFNKWWILESKMLDYDVNESEWK